MVQKEFFFFSGVRKNTTIASFAKVGGKFLKDREFSSSENILIETSTQRSDVAGYQTFTHRAS